MQTKLATTENVALMQCIWENFLQNLTSVPDQENLKYFLTTSFLKKRHSMAMGNLNQSKNIVDSRFVVWWFDPMNLLQIQVEERIDLIGFMSRFKVDRDLTLDLLDIEFFGAIYRGFFFIYLSQERLMHK